jgi:hypothetical protein
MTDTPGSEITKYESLLLMITTAGPEFTFRRVDDEMSRAVIRDLMLMNTVIAQFSVMNEIECRKAIAGFEPRPSEMQPRRVVRRCAVDDEANRRCAHLMRVNETCKLAVLCGGTDVDAFKKYIMKESAVTFSAACNRRLDDLAREKGKEDLSTHILRLENDITRAKMDMDAAKGALSSAEVARNMTSEALKKIEETEDEVKVF